MRGGNGAPCVSYLHIRLSLGKLPSAVWLLIFDIFFLYVIQASGADALELNLSCPHGMGERGMGLACGQVGLLTAISFMSLWHCSTASSTVLP